METRAIRTASVDGGRSSIQSKAEGGDDPVHSGNDLGGACKSNVCLQQGSPAFDPDVVGPVHQHIADLSIPEQRL
jgi:hypothetical protein